MRGHDVVAVTEVAPRASDEDVAERALGEKRILLTEDKDFFGQLVYAHGQRSVRVILLRFPAKARKRIVREVSQFVEEASEGLRGSFAVVEPGRIRLTCAEVYGRPARAAEGTAHFE